MAVLKNNRTKNPLEYERVFNQLYNSSAERIARIPKRRWKLVAEPLLDCLNPAYTAVMGIAYDCVRGRPDYQHIRYERTKQGIRLLLAMQKPLYVYWAISNDKQEYLMHQRNDKNRKTWADEVNHTVNILADVLRANPEYSQEDDVPPNPIVWYTSKEVNSSLLLQSTRGLLLTAQRQCIRLPLGLRDAQGKIVCDLMADAWYRAIQANKNIPRNAEEYITRRTHVSALISDIVKSNRAMLAIFASGNMSEQHMAEWANLLKETNDLAFRIQNSDKKRFGGLK